MDTYDHYAYGLMLATRLKAIRHSADRPRFYKSVETDTLGELEKRLSEAMGAILIAHDGLKSEFDWKNDDNLVESVPYEFLLLQQTESGDSQSVRTACDACKKIAKSIISRMMLDYEAGDNGLQFLQVESFVIEPVGPIRGNFHGVSLLFSVGRGLDYRFDSNDWEE